MRMEKQAVRSIRRITWIGFVANVLIAALKFALGTIGLAIAVVALGIGYNGLETILSGDYRPPARVAVAGAVASILVKEGLYQWTAHVGRKTRSSALLANAWHHRSDAFSSILRRRSGRT